MIRDQNWFLVLRKLINYGKNFAKQIINIKDGNTNELLISNNSIRRENLKIQRQLKNINHSRLVAPCWCKTSKQFTAIQQMGPILVDKLFCTFKFGSSFASFFRFFGLFINIAYWFNGMMCFKNDGNNLALWSRRGWCRWFVRRKNFEKRIQPTLSLTRFRFAQFFSSRANTFFIEVFVAA